MVAVALLLVTLPAAAQSLEELARSVREAARSEAQVNQARETRFLQAREDQVRLLEEARRQLAEENRRSDRLRGAFDVSERTLAELETTLSERMGNLGELFGHVRQFSAEVSSALNDSMVSAQRAGRTAALDSLLSGQELPTIGELRQLWSAVVTEIAESGRVVRFTAAVERTSGETEQMDVVRIGVFNAVADGIFLDWDVNRNPDRLLELARQPASRYARMARELEVAGRDGHVAMAVDFTRGQILRAVVRSKTPAERVREDGGLVGYVIIAIGLLGLLLSAWKAVALYRTGGRMARQIGSASARPDNPLGRVLAVYESEPGSDVQTLELKLDEAILRETAPLESGLNFIRVLYVVAPLLGLLGTVVGMIATFQTITLFGTGDPRMMAGGISTALVTTVLGLIVAIPLTLLHSFLQGKARALVQVLEQQAAGIVARVAEQRS